MEGRTGTDAGLRMQRRTSKALMEGWEEEEGEEEDEERKRREEWEEHTNEVDEK